jgi:hypothetical protein
MSDLFTEADLETLQEAIDTWGIEAQADMAEEEAAEFIAASKHFKRGKTDMSAVVDELADLRIMQEQLSMFIGQERVNQRVTEKMDRLRGRLEDNE